MVRSESDADGAADRFKIPFLVGIVGHRDLVPEQVPAIRDAIRGVLTDLRNAAPHVQIALLSSMADGADLLAAEVASHLGIEIIALLPFAASRCEADLTSEAARATFNRIMVQAERLELPLAAGVTEAELSSGGPARDAQFQRAGALVGRYSSLLIAVWDGQDNGLAAGTARTIGERRRRIRPRSEEHPDLSDLLLGAADNDLIYEIRCSRAGSSAQGQPDAVQVLGFVGGDSDYQGGDVPAALATLLQRTGEFNRDVEDYGSDIAQRGRRLAPPSAEKVPPSLLYIDRLFTAADWLGGHFRHCYTRALRARYALWAVLAFLLLAFKKQHEGRVGLVTILCVLSIFVLGWLLAMWARQRGWQRRYLDYRALAEGLRVDFYWELSGVRTRFEGEFAHESFLQKQDVDLEWIRAAMRTVSLRCALQQPVALPDGFSQTMVGWVGDPNPESGSGQLKYYRARGHALQRRQEIAERVASAMLVGGLALGILLAGAAALELRGPSPLPADWHNLMLWALALLTVYSAIFEIYLGEKADRALIRQYRYMDLLFSFAARELRSAASPAARLDILRSLGHACLAEHAQWTLAHRDKRIEGMRW